MIFSPVAAMNAKRPVQNFEAASSHSGLPLQRKRYVAVVKVNRIKEIQFALWII